MKNRLKVGKIGVPSGDVIACIIMGEENVCCYCGKGGKLYGDFIMKPKMYVWLERYYHLKCKRKEEQNDK